MAISRHVADFIKPLCKATENLLSEREDLDKHDYVRLSVDETYDEHDDQVKSKSFFFEFRSDDPERSTPSYALRGNWWQRIPGAKNLPSSFQCYGFKAPPTDISALCTLAAVGKERIRFSDDAAQLEFWQCVLRFARQTKVARAQAGFKQFRTIPNRAYKGTRGLPPMPQQQVATYCANLSEAYALWMEQSTGKTYTTIMTVDQAHVPGKCQSVILIVPKNLRLNWEQEIGTFSKLRCAVVRLGGGELERANQLLEAFRMKISGEYDAVYVIVAYQSACNSCTNICAYPWDWGIIDEGHYIKWHRTQRSQACLKIREKCKRRLELTGTPITNHAFDLYTQLEFLGYGWSGFTSFDQFKRFYGSWEPIGHGVERLNSMQNVPLLQERIARSAFTITKKEAMPWLPDKAYEIIEVEMSTAQKCVYEALANELYAEIESDMSDNKKTVTVNNILVKLLRLTQVTSGFIALDQEVDLENNLLLPRQIDRFDPNPKLEEMIEWLKQLREDSPDSKVLIWANFVQDIKQISARLAVEGWKSVQFYGATTDDERETNKKLFHEDRDVNYFVGNPQAGGVGMNLTGTGCWPMRCDTVIWYSYGWSPTARSQGDERPRGYLLPSVSPTGEHEKWQIRSVTFACENSIDIEIHNRVRSKIENAMELQDVRSLLHRLIKR